MSIHYHHIFLLCSKRLKVYAKVEKQKIAIKTFAQYPIIPFMTCSYNIKKQVMGVAQPSKIFGFNFEFSCNK